MSVAESLTSGMSVSKVIQIFFIMLTCYVDPPTPVFCKIGVKGVYISFLFFLLTIDCGYSLEPPQSMVKAKI